MGGVRLSPTRSSTNCGQGSEKMQVQPTDGCTSPELSVLASQGGAHPGDSGSGDAACRIVVQAACRSAASCSKPLQIHPQLLDERPAMNHFSSFQEPGFVLQS